MEPTETPSTAAGTPAVATPRRLRRFLRALAWTVGVVLLLVVALGAGAWWWLGSNQSLAFALTQAARYLPAGQTLQSRDVTGSLRTGGTIGFLQWQSPTLSVEVRDAKIGWQLAPLLDRRLQLGEVQASQVLLERRGPVEEKPSEPLAPLERLVLPVDIDLPFRVGTLRWAGPPVVEAKNLAGSYRYVQAPSQHTLVVDNVDVQDGKYDARIALQGEAPMTLDATVNGTVKAPLTEGRTIDLVARATARGDLAGAGARLAVTAAIDPATPDAAAPMQARLRANIAPWQTQPVIDADADLKNIDLAALVPTAPATLLTGRVHAGPAAAVAGSAPAPSGAPAVVWELAADIANAKPAPWDRGGLPLERVEARASFDGTTWTVPAATVRTGRGRIEAEGEWSPAPEPWRIDAKVTNVQLGDLHTQLAGAPVGGRASVEQKSDATLLFDVALQAQGQAGTAALQGIRLDRALAQGQWKDQILDLRTLRIEAAQASVQGQLQVRVAEQAGAGDLKVVVPGGNAQVKGSIAPARGGGDFKARIDDAAVAQRWIERLPGLSTAFGGAAADGAVQLDARWQGGWQAVQRRLQNATTPAPRGMTEPTIQATLAAPRLEIRLPAASVAAGAAGASPAPAAPPIQLRGVNAELSGSLAQATLSLKGEATRGTQKVNLATRASGALESANHWRAAVASLQLQVMDSTRPGPWAVALREPLSANVRTAAGGLEIDTSAGGVTLQGPVPGTVRIDWEPVRFRQTGSGGTQGGIRVQSKGRMQGLPMAWAEAFDASKSLGTLGITGDLVFDGEWDVDAGDSLRASARLARRSGDIRVQAGEAALVTRIQSRGTGTASEITMDSAAGPGGQSPSTPAGLSQAELRLDAQGEAVTAKLVWASERAGTLRAEAATRVAQRDGGWQWPEDAPLRGSVKASMPSLGVWSMLAPPGWRIAGTLEADATLSGNRAAPRWNGTLGADRLALRALVEGLDLRDGRLRATLAGDRVEITEFTLKGGMGSGARIAGQSGNLSTTSSEAARDGGTLSARGELRWGSPPAAGNASGSGIRMALQAQVRSLRVLVRSDRQVTLSGDLQARLDDGQISLRGKLTTDRAVIILPDETAPSLGSDVVVRSAAKEREAAAKAQKDAARTDAQAASPQTAKPPDVAITFDLGRDFAVQGRGITTRLEGSLDIRSNSASAPPRITGEVRTVKGQYRAYGQQLDVETGLARFNGPYDNPSLDILAIRPNISQRAGVQVTGTAQAPRVKLYSEPALSDVETLSWVVLGRASASSGGESVLMQQAALALLGGFNKGGSGGSLASRLGLDEIGFKGPSGGDLRESGVTLGKRLSKDFYLTYESSLAGAIGTVYIFYDLTQRLTLRGQAGQLSALDVIYTVKYD
ncbi:MAG: translocation/assembly module TamB [Variovorax sp.]|nr:MAG: translocation/assembly module TamB [Variovorax sp.]